MRCSKWKASSEECLANDTLLVTDDGKSSDISYGIKEIMVKFVEICLKLWDYVKTPIENPQDVSLSTKTAAAI